MSVFFNTISYILAIFGLVELVLKFRKWISESTLLSLISWEKVVQWQAEKISYASYIAAKKFYRINLRLKRKQGANLYLELSKNYYNIRKRMHDNIKANGMNTEEFNLLKKQADAAISKITGIQYYSEKSDKPIRKL